MHCRKGCSTSSTPGQRFVTLTDMGRDFLEEGLGPLYDGAPAANGERRRLNITRRSARRQASTLNRSHSIANQVLQSLRGHLLLKRDADYLVGDDEVVLIDQHTREGQTGQHLPTRAPGGGGSTGRCEGSPRIGNVGVDFRVGVHQPLRAGLGHHWYRPSGRRGVQAQIRPRGGRVATGQSIQADRLPAQGLFLTGRQDCCDSLCGRRPPPDEAAGAGVGPNGRAIGGSESRAVRLWHSPQAGSTRLHRHQKPVLFKRREISEQ